MDDGGGYGSVLFTHDESSRIHSFLRDLSLGIPPSKLSSTLATSSQSSVSTASRSSESEVEGGGGDDGADLVRSVRRGGPPRRHHDRAPPTEAEVGAKGCGYRVSMGLLEEPSLAARAPRWEVDHSVSVPGAAPRAPRLAGPRAEASGRAPHPVDTTTQSLRQVPPGGAAVDVVPLGRTALQSRKHVGVTDEYQQPPLNPYADDALGNGGAVCRGRLAQHQPPSVKADGAANTSGRPMKGSSASLLPPHRGTGRPVRASSRYSHSAPAPNLVSSRVSSLFSVDPLIDPRADVTRATVRGPASLSIKQQYPLRSRSQRERPPFRGPNAPTPAAIGAKLPNRHPSSADESRRGTPMAGGFHSHLASPMRGAGSTLFGASELLSTMAEGPMGQSFLHIDPGERPDELPHTAGPLHSPLLLSSLGGGGLKGVGAAATARTLQEQMEQFQVFRAAEERRLRKWSAELTRRGQALANREQTLIAATESLNRRERAIAAREKKLDADAATFRHKAVTDATLAEVSMRQRFEAQQLEIAKLRELLSERHPLQAMPYP